MKRLTQYLSFFLLFVLNPLNAYEKEMTSPSYIIEERLIADLRLLANGSLAPLIGFMNEDDYLSVLHSSRLAKGSLFPLPIVLPIPAERIEEIKRAGLLTLKNRQGHTLASIKVESIYLPDLENECLSAFGTVDTNHPGVRTVLSRKNHYYVGGQVHPFPHLAHLDKEESVWSPQQTKEFFAANRWNKVVAFQTRNPLHRAHVALIQKCLSDAGNDAALFLQPVIGPTQDEDIPAPIRKKCYEVLRPYLDTTPVHIGYLPLAMRMAGPKEALLHALIRKNYGATHFIVGRDHAGPSAKDQNGKPFYPPYAAQELVMSHAKELGLQILSSQEMVFVPELSSYLPEDALENHHTPARISGTQVREKMQKGLPLPDWFSFPEVLKILTQYYAKKTGLCIYLIGLPSAGKTTIAHALKKRLESIDPLQREAIILDGDVIRSHLAAELGFSKKDRSTNVQRIGYVANLLAEAGALCIVANIAPYDEDRLTNRALISSKGTYVEVFIDTPLRVCEERDVKGLYRLAREGKIKNLTGVDDPYEPPSRSDLILDGSQELSECLDQICNQLKKAYPLYKEI